MPNATAEVKKRGIIPREFGRRIGYTQGGEKGWHNSFSGNQKIKETRTVAEGRAKPLANGKGKKRLVIILSDRGGVSLLERICCSVEKIAFEKAAENGKRGKIKEKTGEFYEEGAKTAAKRKEKIVRELINLTAARFVEGSEERGIFLKRGGEVTCRCGKTPRLKSRGKVAIRKSDRG